MCDKERVNRDWAHADRALWYVGKCCSLPLGRVGEDCPLDTVCHPQLKLRVIKNLVKIKIRLHNLHNSSIHNFIKYTFAFVVLWIKNMKDMETQKNYVDFTFLHWFYTGLLTGFLHWFNLRFVSHRLCSVSHLSSVTKAGYKNEKMSTQGP